MAPKKELKKEPKNKKTKGDVAVGSGGGSNQPSPREFQQQLEALQLEKAKEEKERNYAVLERDKIAAFLEIKKKEFDQSRAELRIKDRQLEELEERHQDEIKVYKQKMKHVLYEQQNIIATIKSEHELNSKLQREQAAKREMEILNDQRGLKERIKELELAQEDALRQVKLDHAKEMTKMKQEFDVTAKELHLKTEKKIKAIRDDCELRRKQEVHEIEERKNNHINELMKNHEKAFTEIKCYYNDITHNNLDLIKTLKEDMTDMKKKEAANEKLMYDIAQENKKLTEPLTRALKEVENLRKQLANYEKDKLSLRRSRAAHSEALKQLKNLEFEKGLLHQKFDEVQGERDELLKKIDMGISEVQQKCELRNLLLQGKVQVLAENLEKKDAQLADAIAMAVKDPNIPCTNTNDSVKAIEMKNKELKKLHYELGRMNKTYKDLVQAFQLKLVEYGIPLEEMGIALYVSTN